MRSKRASTSSWRSRSPWTARPRGKMLALAEEADEKNLKVGVGLMWRHCRGAAGTCTTASATARSATSSRMRAYRMHGPIGSFLSPPEAGRNQRPDVPDPAVPQLPLGQRRLLQRLLHPQHRRVLLDEGRLAGQGPGARRTSLSRRRRRSELRHLLRWNTPSPTGRSCSAHGRCMPGCDDEFGELRPRHQRARP